MTIINPNTTNQTLDNIRRALSDQGRHIIATHIRPDADAACSVTALIEALPEEADIRVLNLAEVSNTASRCGILFPTRATEYYPQEDDSSATLWVLDCSTWDRVAGTVGEYHRSVVIDHHPETDDDIIANDMVKDTKASSTGELILDMLISGMGEVNDLGVCAATRAIIGDTGNLTLPNVTSRTLYVLSWARSQLSDINWNAMQWNFRERSLEAMQAQAKAILNAHQLEDVAFVASSENVLPEARAGLANQLLDIPGVRFSFTVLPDSAGQPYWRCAVRCSPEVSGAAKDVASAFGGGGHACASGCSFSWSEYPTADAAAGAIIRNYWQSLADPE